MASTSAERAEYLDTTQLMEADEESKAPPGEELNVRTFSNLAVDVTEKLAEESGNEKKVAGSAFFPTQVPWIINPKSAYVYSMGAFRSAVQERPDPLHLNRAATCANGMWSC